MSKYIVRYQNDLEGEIIEGSSLEEVYSDFLLNSEIKEIPIVVTFDSVLKSGKQEKVFSNHKKYLKENNLLNLSVYEVNYSLDAPSDLIEIEAHSPKEAFLEFVSRRGKRNDEVIVNWGLTNSERFIPSEYDNFKKQVESKALNVSSTEKFIATTDAVLDMRANTKYPLSRKIGDITYYISLFLSALIIVLSLVGASIKNSIELGFGGILTGLVFLIITKLAHEGFLMIVDLVDSSLSQLELHSRNSDKSEATESLINSVKALTEQNKRSSDSIEEYIKKLAKQSDDANVYLHHILKNVKK